MSGNYTEELEPVIYIWAGCIKEKENIVHYSV